MNAPYHKGNVRPELLKQGLKLLKSEGIEAISVRRLAREVGVVPSAVYNHFENRDGLLAAIAADGFRQLSKLEQKGFDSGRSFKDSVKMVAREYLVFANKNPDLYRLMFSYEVSNYKNFPELFQASDSSFASSVRWWYGEGAYDSDRPAAEYPAPLVVWASLHGLAMIVIERSITLKKYDSASVGALAEDFTENLFGGLGKMAPKEKARK